MRSFVIDLCRVFLAHDSLILRGGYFLLNASQLLLKSANLGFKVLILSLQFIHHLPEICNLFFKDITIHLTEWGVWLALWRQ